MGTLELVIVLLVVLWALGMFTAVTMGGAIHLLLLLALIGIVWRIWTGRNPLR